MNATCGSWLRRCCRWRWLGIFLPVAIVWWLLKIVVALAVWLFRASARLRARLCGG